MWMIGETEENDPGILHAQARDIADQNFAGVLIVPRAGTLDIRNPKYLEIFAAATDAAKSANLEPWLMADPRLASDSLISDTGECLEVLIPVNVAGDLKIPEIPLRPTHMHQSGGITYKYSGIEKQFSTKTGELYFLKYKTNFFDYSNPGMWVFWEDYVEELFRKIDGFTGMCWDEPGYYCDNGRLPWSKHIVDAFQRAYGYDIREKLNHLLTDSPDYSHIKVRNNYYEKINDTVYEAMKENYGLIRKLPGGDEKFTVGIHATWHGEFCGIEERNHGSMDIWNLRSFQTAAFTDIGETEKLIEPGKGPDVLYSLVLARSLSRVGPNRGLVYSNLWGINFGHENDSASVEILDYWSDLLDLFGARWLAHSYGWPGTRYTDLNFGPGYPDHPTWDHFKIVNGKILGSLKNYDTLEDITDVLVVYPLESFYAVGREIFREPTQNFVRLIDNLTRSGYQVDIVSSTWLKDATVNGKSILLNGCEYKSLIIPHCTVITDTVHELAGTASDAGIPVIVGSEPHGPVFKSGIPAPLPESVTKYFYNDDPMHFITVKIEPAYILPEGSLGNVFRSQSRYRIILIADRPFGKYGGIFKFAGHQIKISERTEPFEIELPLEL